MPIWQRLRSLLSLRRFKHRISGSFTRRTSHAEGDQNLSSARLQIGSPHMSFDGVQDGDDTLIPLAISDLERAGHQLASSGDMPNHGPNTRISGFTVAQVNVNSQVETVGPVVGITSQEIETTQLATMVQQLHGCESEEDLLAVAEPEGRYSFDEIEEVDVDNDKPYWISAGYNSFAGYLPSDDEDETDDCVICKYVDPKHRHKHRGKEQPPELPATLRTVTSTSRYSTSASTSSLPQKRRLPGLESSKHNPDRNVKPRLETSASDSKATTNAPDTFAAHPLSSFDGAFDTFDLLPPPLRSRRRDSPTEPTLNILPYAEKAGVLVSDSERALALALLPPLSSPPTTPKKPKKPKQIKREDDPALEATQATEQAGGDHHSLPARLARNADTTALLDDLAHTAHRRSPEQRRARGRAVIKSACALCCDEKLVSPLLCDEGMPCVHRAPARPVARSKYKMQPSNDTASVEVQKTKPARIGDSKWVPSPESWCYCGKPYTGKTMYRCCNEECFIGWFHERCLRVARGDGKVPWRTAKWYCDICALIEVGGAKGDKVTTPMFTEAEVLEVFGPRFGQADGDGGSGDAYGLARRGEDASSDVSSTSTMV